MQVWWLTSTCTAPVRPRTATGVVKVPSVRPAPSIPLVFAPQHHTVPSLARPHAVSIPIASCTSFALPSADVETGVVGVPCVAVVPSPSWPTALLPQQ